MPAKAGIPFSFAYLTEAIWFSYNREMV